MGSKRAVLQEFKNFYMIERNFYPIFKEINKTYGVFELKLAKNGKPLPFKALDKDQIQSLLDVSGNDGLYHKIPDGFNRFGGNSVSQKPFDCFQLKNVSAFVVAIYYMPRKYKNFFYISIKDWLKEKEISKRKSLTSQRAEEISKIKINL